RYRAGLRDQIVAARQHVEDRFLRYLSRMFERNQSRLANDDRKLIEEFIDEARVGRAAASFDSIHQHVRVIVDTLAGNRGRTVSSSSGSSDVSSMTSPSSSRTGSTSTPTSFSLVSSTPVND